MAFTVVSFPVCPGTLSLSAQTAAGYSVNCSMSWSQASGILLDPSYQVQLDLMLNQSGIDWTYFGIGFGSCLTMLASGLITGVFINLTRKLK